MHFGTFCGGLSLAGFAHVSAIRIKKTSRRYFLKSRKHKFFLIRQKHFLVPWIFFVFPNGILIFKIFLEQGPFFTTCEWHDSCFSSCDIQFSYFTRGGNYG